MPETILPRLRAEEREALLLSPRASLSAKSRGRVFPEPECDTRTAFQRDIDRITYSKSFRRLMHKTQVFLRPEGDHFRTRLTHTLEVARISRTISRALGLNEDLTEAIALGHDLGHTPFGHAGERALNKIMNEKGGFSHNAQSLRVVDKLEKDGRGLNLTFETRDGIINHPRGYTAVTLEGEAVSISDRLAYVNHDADDAMRAGILAAEDIPSEIVGALGETFSKRIDTLVCDVLLNFDSTGKIAFSEKTASIFEEYYSFLNERVYLNRAAKGEETKVFGILNGIFGHYVSSPDKLPSEYSRIRETEGDERAVCDYIAGMTDGFALQIYKNIFIPKSWELEI